MICALGMADIRKALDAHSAMTEVNKRHPSTQYLLYKVALRSQNAELGKYIEHLLLYYAKAQHTAAQCLEEISAHSTKDATLLYACVLEAQRAGDRMQSVASMQRVLENMSMLRPMVCIFQLCSGNVTIQACLT